MSLAPVIYRRPQSVMTNHGAIERITEKVIVSSDAVTVAPSSGQNAPLRAVTAPRVLSSFLTTAQKLRRIFSAAAKQQEMEHQNTFITAIIPAYNEQRSIVTTLSSLLLQTRVPDKIIVIVNGSTDNTAFLVKHFCAEFPGVVVMENNPSVIGRSGKLHEVKSKVGALNYAWKNYIESEPMRGTSEFVLGIDADVELAPDAVELLERSLLDDDDLRIGGVRAAYGFRSAKSDSLRVKSLIAAQKLDFAATELRDQLRPGSKVDILGGQATLFRREALQIAAEEKANKGHGPWYRDTLVEDAYLTRIFESNGYIGIVNRDARVTVGAMPTPQALQAQRRKWQNGHIIDISGGKKFGLDRSRWGQQFALGWNYLLRVSFFALLIFSLISGQFAFSPLMLIPLGLAMLQNLLIASRMHDRSNLMILRAVTYILPEVHIWRTLAVWVMSLRRGILALVKTGIVRTGTTGKKNDWLKQAIAEASKRKSAWATWSTIIMSVVIPAGAMMAISYRFPFAAAYLLHYGWLVVAVMAIISSLFMVIKILKIAKHWKYLSL